MKTLTDSFDVAFEDLRVADQESPQAQQIGRFLKELGRIAAAAEERGASVHLHFARKFSSPSETFIHNFLTDLCAQAEGVLHVMLCDERQEEDSRSYPYVLTLPWDELDQTIREVLYGVVWDRLAPARIVAHFALNGWWLHNRLSREQRDRPWVNGDLAQRDTNNKSIRLAELLVQELTVTTRMAKLRQASFVVLQSPDMPSVLVELGYLSNPADEKALADDAHIARLARAVARAVDEYFEVATS